MWSALPVKCCRRSAVGLRGDDAQVDSQIGVGLGHQLGVAALVDPGQFGEGGEGVHDCGRRGRGGHKVDVAHRGPEAAQAAGVVGGDHFRQGAQGLHQPDRLRLDHRTETAKTATPGSLGHPGLDGVEDLRLGLLSHAGDLADAALPAGALERPDVYDTRRFPQQPGLLGSHPGQVHDGEQSFRIALAEALEKRDLPAGHEFEDFRLDGLPHTGQFAQFTARSHVGD